MRVKAYPGYTTIGIVIENDESKASASVKYHDMDKRIQVRMAEFHGPDPEDWSFTNIDSTGFVKNEDLPWIKASIPPGFSSKNKKQLYPKGYSVYVKFVTGDVERALVEGADYVESNLTVSGTVSSSSPVSFSGNTENMNKVQKAVIDFLCQQGLQPSTGIGVCANIEQECSYDISIDAPDGPGGYSAGMCQWHAGRRSSMISYVGSDWKTNLDGQIRYMWKELNGGYVSVLNVMKSASNTVEDAKTVAEKFCRVFEGPANVNTRVSERRSIAERIWGETYGGSKT